jgi:hypothetical protein
VIKSNDIVEVFIKQDHKTVLYYLSSLYAFISMGVPGASVRSGQRSSVFIGTFLLVLATGCTAQTANYYVDPTGNDSNPGTLAAPWKTAIRAFNTTQLQPGDTIYFRQGDYILTDPDNFLYPKKSGRSGAPITFKSYNGEKATIIWGALTPPSNGRSRILYIGVSDIVINGLNFYQTEESRRLTIIENETLTPRGRNSSTSINGIGVWGDNVTVRNCSIDNVSGPGIGVNGSNFLVENCRITNTGSHGFYIRGLNGIYRYNLVDGSRGHWNQQGIQIQYASSRGNKIYSNLMRNGQASGVGFSGQITNNEVFNNVIINGGSKTSGGGYAVNFWCEDGPIGAGNKFYNNTVIGKSNSGLIMPGECKNKDQGPLCRNVEIYNNIFYPSSPVQVGLSTSKVRNNIFYNVIGSVPSGNILADPKLTNPTGTNPLDAMLKEGSQAIDTAVSGAPPFDYQNGKRSFGAAADKGAFEFGASPGSGGPIFVPPVSSSRTTQD